MTANGHLNATTDRDQIKLWWTKWPNAMIGAKVPDSLLVVDLDPRNGGDLEKLVALVGDLPPTLSVWSGRNDGGRHLYYQRPAGTLTSTACRKALISKPTGTAGRGTPAAATLRTRPDGTLNLNSASLCRSRRRKLSRSFRTW